MLATSRPNTQESVASATGVDLTIQEVQPAQDTNPGASQGAQIESAQRQRVRSSEKKLNKKFSLEERRRGTYNDSFTADDESLYSKFSQNLSFDEVNDFFSSEKTDLEKKSPETERKLTESIFGPEITEKFDFFVSQTKKSESKQNIGHKIIEGGESQQKDDTAESTDQPKSSKVASESSRPRGVVKQASIAAMGHPGGASLALVGAVGSVDPGDRKALREALYEGIFRRHRSAIFALGSFVRMLRSRNAQYNTIRSSSEGEES